MRQHQLASHLATLLITLSVFCSNSTFVYPQKYDYTRKDPKTESSTEDKKDSILAVMSFNIRYDNPEDGANRWEKRLDGVITCLSKEQPDLIGMQEVLHNQLLDLQKKLENYNYYGVGREDGQTKGEYQPIFWKKERFRLLDSGHFWLSETPDVPSFGWDAACERTAVWLILKDRLDGTEYFIMNTHFDHQGETARRESVKMTRLACDSLSNGRKVIFTGDLNATPESSVVISLLAPASYSHNFIDAKKWAKKKIGPEWTYHDFGQLKEEERSRIDYVLLQKFQPNDILSHSTITEGFSKSEKPYLSDHAPIMVKIRLHQKKNRR